MTLAAYENPATTYMLGTSSEQSFGKHTREDASPLHQKQVSRSLSYLDLLGSSRSSSLQSVFPRYTQELLLNLGMQQQQQQQQHQPQDSSLWSNHQRSSSLRSIGSQQDVLNLGSLAGAQQLRSRSSSTGSSSSSETVAPIMTGTFSCGPNSPKRSFDEMIPLGSPPHLAARRHHQSVASTSSGQHYQSNIDLVALLSKSQSPSRTMNSLRSESFSSASSHPGHFQQQQQQVSDEYLPRESRKRPRLGSFVSGDSLLQQFPFLAQSKADSILSRPPSTQHQPQQYQETSAFSSQYFSALNNTNLPRTDSRESLLLELQRQQQQQQQQQNPPPVPVVQAPLQEISKPCSKRSKRAGKLCTVEGCNTRDKGGGLCAKHGGGRRMVARARRSAQCRVVTREIRVAVFAQLTVVVVAAPLLTASAATLGVASAGHMAVAVAAQSAIACAAPLLMAFANCTLAPTAQSRRSKKITAPAPLPVCLPACLQLNRSPALPQKPCTCILATSSEFQRSTFIMLPLSDHKSYESYLLPGTE
eukprot:CAMPEP_0171550346 /NCGR_PEP_ID=MMETSP0960-20121227/7001_1 /TAXON_ID=87120 /ORGANISM="Aurantiochytrium limacinum, Strain ATCCMYA-1381" /LENGTH=530 /DNA_ID=CAMNT_0012099247 /DNA_START=255 /DNA_END=1848 /DNA_ORIENTATION=+